MTRISSLDGLRAISILLVLGGHLVGTANYPAFGLAFGLWADLGVRIFFVISGYLITALLLREHDRTGRISLPAFYIRRTRRIFPAFYAYLAVIALTVGLPWSDLWHAATYTTNYHLDPARSWYVGHLWSLSVEEQFYLLWPLVLVLAGRRALPIAVGAIVLAPLARAAGLLWFGDRVVHEAGPMVMDALAAGCALALYRVELHQWALYRYLLRAPWVGWLLPLGLALVGPPFPWGLAKVVMPSVANVGIVLLLDRVMTSPPVLLNGRAIVWVGTLSYSMYLWQQPLLHRDGTSWVTAFPVNLMLVFGCAIVSHYLIERPCLVKPATVTSVMPA
jgi:peptidoglycan/LPS O-acetylase OafA/YrhL